MSHHRLIEHFHLLAAAPGGIKTLRQLILQLAVQGKLLPQDPADEPASALLKRIRAEKAKLVADGKIKKDKPLTSIAVDEQPYKLPQGWEWIRLEDISNNIHYGYTASADHSATGIRMLRITDIQNDKVNWPSVPGCDISRDSYSAYALCDGDILIARTGGTIGKSYLVENLNVEAVFASYLIRVVPSSQCNPLFTKLFLGSSLYWAQLTASSMGTGQPNVNGTALKALSVPLPPLAEQSRIVVKVDELMALCDDLETQQLQAGQAHAQLVTALLGDLAASADAAAFATYWQRIASHFTTVFDTVDSIDQLKQTVLQLAVQGKLVPQDPTDESASTLLKRIQAEKAKLAAEGKIKKDKPLQPIAEDETPYALPLSWKWVKLGDIALQSDAGWSPQCEAHPRKDEEWGVLKVSAVSWGRFLPEKNKSLPSTLQPKTEYEVMPGDFLISRANTSDLVAKAVVVEDEAPKKLILSDKIIRIRFSGFVEKHYLLAINNSSFSRTYYAAVAGGTSSSMKNVSREQIKNLLVPLAPAAEQSRIVAKVDELLTLCDTLRTQLLTRQTAAQQLASTIAQEVTP